MIPTVNQTGHVRVCRRSKYNGTVLSKPVPCVVVFVSRDDRGRSPGGRFVTVKLLADPGVRGWTAGDSYRCESYEFVPDVATLADVLNHCRGGVAPVPAVRFA